MSETLSLAIVNDSKEVANASHSLNQFLDSKGLTPRIRYAVNLVFEELLINILKYAYKDDKTHTVEVQVTMEADKIAIAFQDDGIPFNPLSVPRPDRSKPAIERVEKGLGINLVRSMRKAMEYRRGKNKNVLKVWIDL